MVESNFCKSIMLGFKDWSDFNSRSSRAHFWLWNAFYTLSISIILAIGQYYFLFKIIGEILILVLFIPSLSICVRRLHDINASGYKLLWPLLPIIGLIMCIYWWCQKGDAQLNRFGNPPPIIGVTKIDIIILIVGVVLIIVI